MSQKCPEAEEAPTFFGAISDIERTSAHLYADERQMLRHLQKTSVLETLHRWLVLRQEQAIDELELARVIDYIPKR